MNIVYERLAALPAIIRAFAYNNEAWIVGSAAQYLLGLKEDLPRDWDVLIPFWQWGPASKTIPEGTPTNSHGGINLQNDGVSLDVWAGDIGWFLGQVPNQPAYAVQPLTRTFLVSGRGAERTTPKVTRSQNGPPKPADGSPDPSPSSTFNDVPGIGYNKPRDWPGRPG